MQIRPTFGNSEPQGYAGSVAFNRIPESFAGDLGSEARSSCSRGLGGEGPATSSPKGPKYQAIRPFGIAY